MIPTQSAKHLPGYFWTIADQRIDWCSGCAQPRATYCEEAGGDDNQANVRCCTCQRIIRTLNTRRE